MCCKTQRREREKTKQGRTVAPTTVRKEIAMLSAVWTWAQDRYDLTPFPNTRKLSFGKMREKSPFQTWREIEEQIAREGLSEE